MESGRKRLYIQVIVQTLCKESWYTTVKISVKIVVDSEGDVRDGRHTSTILKVYLPFFLAILNSEFCFFHRLFFVNCFLYTLIPPTQCILKLL